MNLINLSQFKFILPNVKIGRLSAAEQIVFWTIILTPLWWILGIQPLLYPAIIIFLFLRSIDLDKIIRNPPPICIWSWLAMSLIMLWTALVGISNGSLGMKETLATIVTFAKGYFLIFTCLVLPFLNLIRTVVITRAVAWMASGYLVSICLQVMMLFVGFTEDFIPPWARYFPGNPASFIVQAPTFQAFFGVLVPRTTLYFPDPPILGICGLLCFIICLGEPSRSLRRWGLLGSFTALVISQSRLAWICLPISLTIYVVFRSQGARLGSLWTGALAALLCTSLGGMTVAELLNKPLEIFTSARPASSTDREFVVRKTLEAWQESPWLGWGVAQGTADWHIYSITLGSFSTYAAVLYLHGVVGFMFFLVALLSTLWNLWRLAIKGNSESQQALGAVIALIIFMEAIPLSWMAVYFWFFFVWVGSILVDQKIKNHNPIKVSNS